MARSGEGAPFLADLRAELEKRFGPSSAALLPASLSPGVLMVYAYLAKDLAFEAPFAVNLEGGLNFQGVKLPCFGIWPGDEESKRAARAEQVSEGGGGEPLAE